MGVVSLPHVKRKDLYPERCYDSSFTHYSAAAGLCLLPGVESTDSYAYGDCNPYGYRDCHGYVHPGTGYGDCYAYGDDHTNTDGNCYTNGDARAFANAGGISELRL
jgi:hypothetical protein